MLGGKPDICVLLVDSHVAHITGSWRKAKVSRMHPNSGASVFDIDLSGLHCSCYSCELLPGVVNRFRISLSIIFLPFEIHVPCLICICVMVSTLLWVISYVFIFSLAGALEVVRLRINLFYVKDSLRRSPFFVAGLISMPFWFLYKLSRCHSVILRPFSAFIPLKCCVLLFHVGYFSLCDIYTTNCSTFQTPSCSRSFRSARILVSS